ncbi:MAG: hypothetical protein IJG24_02020 [Selenomonadaceae bacterium]|nr:hypothetical protein [Selenomonadaceae bacterium]
MEESFLLKSIFEIGVAGGIAFYLLSKTTDAIKMLAGSVDKLADKVEKLDNRVNAFERLMQDLKLSLDRQEKHFEELKELLRKGG